MSLFTKKPVASPVPTIDSIRNKINETHDDLIDLEVRLTNANKADEDRIAKLQDAILERNAKLKFIAETRATFKDLIGG